jgi:crotonobetainyl-CoA:carnitine CoA-transferase CaiB-like acyl-CoA transferase
VDRPEWLTDPRFETGSARRRHCTELIGLLDEIFAARTRAEWGAAFDRAGMWWAPVHTIEEVLEDEQLAAAGALVEVPDGGGTATMISTPADFGGTPWRAGAMPPDLGEHTDEVLRELGYDDAAVDALRAGGAVR